jgi:hypothetical protein
MCVRMAVCLCVWLAACLHNALHMVVDVCLCVCVTAAVCMCLCVCGRLAVCVGLPVRVYVRMAFALLVETIYHLHIISDLVQVQYLLVVLTQEHEDELVSKDLLGQCLHQDVLHVLYLLVFQDVEPRQHYLLAPPLTRALQRKFHKKFLNLRPILASVLL